MDGGGAGGHVCPNNSTQHYHGPIQWVFSAAEEREREKQLSHVMDSVIHSVRDPDQLQLVHSPQVSGSSPGRVLWLQRYPKDGASPAAWTCWFFSFFSVLFLVYLSTNGLRRTALLSRRTQTSSTWTLRCAHAVPWTGWTQTLEPVLWGPCVSPGNGLDDEDVLSSDRLLHVYSGLWGGRRANVTTTNPST